MDNIKKININDMPRWFRAILALLPLIFIIKIPTELNNDFYFLYPMGKHIFNNGFPTHDILSMHSGMDIVVQQWLTTVIFYLTYSTFGKMGMYLLTIAAYIIFVLVMLRLCKLVSGNHFISCVAATVAAFFVSMYEATRPQIFTYIILAAELYFIEKYVKTGKARHLVALPVLSVLLVNVHSSMWALIFVLMLPYLVGGVKFKIFNFRNDPSYKLLPLMATFVISGVAGFANPYGLGAMTYILTSFGYEEISNMVTEMKPLDPTGQMGISVLVIVAIVGIAILKSGAKLDCRTLLLYGGLTVFAMMSYKSAPYFFIGVAPVFAYYMKDKSFCLTIKKSSNNKTTAILLSAVIVAAGLVAAGTVSVCRTDTKSENKVNVYRQLDGAISILDNADEDIVLYAGYNFGQYAEFYGYHPYIDSRAEIFLKDNNHEYDYMSEYYRVQKAEIYYKDFLNKYKFNYLIVSSGEPHLYSCLLHDDDYELLFDGADMVKEITGSNTNIKNKIALFALKDR